MKKIRYIFYAGAVLLVILSGVLWSRFYLIKEKNKSQGINKREVASRQYGQLHIKPSPTLIPTPQLSLELTPVPTVRPLSFEESNQKYGPCANVNVLMYHHIEDEQTAVANKRTGLNVTPEFFRKHMEYLNEKKYNIISPVDLVNFFKGTEKLPPKPVVITLDDAYEDNYTNMWPILREFGFKATIFTPTGLINNPDYLTWDQIKEMSSLVYFANHTWSHHSSSGSKDVQEKEIGIADKQLSERGFNPNKIFAYPYGSPSTEAQAVLAQLNYNIAFTTKHGTLMCKGQKFVLPRVRVGNAPLSRYGL